MPSTEARIKQAQRADIQFIITPLELLFFDNLYCTLLWLHILPAEAAPQHLVTPLPLNMSHFITGCMGIGCVSIWRPAAACVSFTVMQPPTQTYLCLMDCL